MGGISKSFVNGFNKPFIFCLLLELTICLQNMIDLFIIGPPAYWRSGRNLAISGTYGKSWREWKKMGARPKNPKNGNRRVLSGRAGPVFPPATPICEFFATSSDFLTGPQFSRNSVVSQASPTLSTHYFLLLAVLRGNLGASFHAFLMRSKGIFLIFIKNYGIIIKKR